MTIKNKKIMGFTLAEVLITLGVIGVVAALTIPTLFANYQKTQYVAQLKKAYAVTSQALQEMALDAGCPSDLVCAGFFNGGTSDSSLFNAFSNKLKVMKDCGTDEGCFPPNSAVTVYYNGSGSRGTFAGQYAPSYKFTLADGIAVAIHNYASGCSYGVDMECGEIIFDVNGTHGPNNIGKDIFIYRILHNATISPNGMNVNGTCNEANPFGLYCAARIMKDGWQMNYDDAGSTHIIGT